MGGVELKLLFSMPVRWEAAEDVLQLANGLHEVLSPTACIRS